MIEVKTEDGVRGQLDKSDAEDKVRGQLDRVMQRTKSEDNWTE